MAAVGLDLLGGATEAAFVSRVRANLVRVSTVPFFPSPVLRKQVRLPSGEITVVGGSRAALSEVIQPAVGARAGRGVPVIRSYVCRVHGGDAPSMSRTFPFVNDGVITRITAVIINEVGSEGTTSGIRLFFSDSDLISDSAPTGLDHEILETFDDTNNFFRTLGGTERDTAVGFKTGVKWDLRCYAPVRRRQRGAVFAAVSTVTVTAVFEVEEGVVVEEAVVLAPPLALVEAAPFVETGVSPPPVSRAVRRAPPSVQPSFFAPPPGAAPVARPSPGQPPAPEVGQFFTSPPGVPTRAAPGPGFYTPPPPAPLRIVRRIPEFGPGPLVPFIGQPGGPKP